MAVSVSLVSNLGHQALGTFLSHLDCEVSFFSNARELASSKAKVCDLVFIDERALKSEEDYHYVRRYLNQKLQAGERTKVYFLDEALKNFKIPHMGAFSPEDFNAFKLVVEEAEQMTSYDFSGEEHALDGAEVIDLTDEEVIDEQSEILLKAISDVALTQSIDELGLSLSKGLESLTKQSGRRGVFFKYLPTYCSLVALSSFHFGEQNINGVGLNFSNSKDFNPNLHFSRLKEIPAFSSVVEKVFKHKDIDTYVFTCESEARGVLVYERVSQGVSDYEFRILCDYANQKLNSIVFRHKFIQNKRVDELSGCVLRESFFEQLQNEIIRSRRVLLPVTVMLFEIDGFYGVKAKYNQERVKVLIKSFAKVLQDNIRHNDLVGRLGEGRFAVLFPHMSTQDGITKAKKISKVFAQTQFFNDMKNRLICSTSIALGTYPSQVSSADELLVALETALSNKESVASIYDLKPKAGFVKDFEEQKLPQTFGTKTESKL